MTYLLDLFPLEMQIACFIFLSLDWTSHFHNLSSLNVENTLLCFDSEIFLPV